MGLTPHGRGRGRGRGSFPDRHWGEVGMINNRAVFTSVPNTTLYPATSTRFHMNPVKTGKFFQENQNGKEAAKGSDSQGAIMTKLHFTDQTKNETHKPKFSKNWRKTKRNGNWNKSRVLPGKNMSDTHNYYCETCDKKFRMQEDLFLHKAEHETCNCDGCEFTAHPKIIAKHIKMQHESGLYIRMGKLNTEEDIAKWIEERKKRYPTRKVIEDKKVLEAEKLNRGERIKDNDSKFNKSFNKRSRKGCKKNFIKQTQRTSKNRRRRKQETSLLQKHLEEERTEDYRKGVPAFSGIGNTSEPEVPERSESFISDDDEWETEHVAPDSSKMLLNGSLGLLAEFYNSDEDNPSQESQNEFVTKNISGDEESHPEEVKTVSVKKSIFEEKSNDRKVSCKRKFFEKKEMAKSKRKNTYKQYNIEKRSSTLLEKLLKNEIRHERNVILQCIHHIVNNNFFKL